jgi:ankyrin repeat protein
MVFLLANGVDPNSTEKDGNSPLHMAASNFGDSLKTTYHMRTLLNYGADPTLINDRGNKPEDNIHNILYQNNQHA